MLGTLQGLPAKSRRKVGMTSSPHGLYAPGYTRATMGGTEGCEPATVSESQKAALSSDRSLQLDCVKLESLVIADQHAAVNTFPNQPKHTQHTTGSAVGWCVGVFGPRERIHRGMLIRDY